MMNDMILTEGIVFAYSAYFRSDKPIRFQIWRPVVNGTKDSYRLIGETRVIPSVTNAREDVSAVFVVLWDFFVMLENPVKLRNINKHIRYKCEIIDFLSEKVMLSHIEICRPYG